MKLIMIHGRSQEDKDPDILRHSWVTALRKGAATAGLELPIDEDDMVFPYYGDALRDVTAEEPVDSLARIAMAIPDFDDLEFRCRVLNDCLDGQGISEEMTAAALDEETRERGPLTREWVQKGLALLDRYVPGASAASLSWVAEDVAKYLYQPNVRGYIENGVARAFRRCDEDEPIVVIGHSMGSIVAYSMLRAQGPVVRQVKALITIGSPLGITAVREALSPIGHPPRVGSWFNAYDEKDAVALFPLDRAHFDINPAIKNYGGVDNDSPNHHNITGYLEDRVVATRIIQALRD